MLASRKYFGKRYARHEQWIRDVAADRPGVPEAQLTVSWWEPCPSGVWVVDFFKWCVGFASQQHAVSYTPKEIEAMDRAILPKMQTQELDAKTAQVLVSHANNVWPGDSRDHLALRRTGLLAYIMFLQSVPEEPNSLFRWLFETEPRVPVLLPRTHTRFYADTPSLFALADKPAELEAPKGEADANAKSADGGGDGDASKTGNDMQDTEHRRIGPISSRNPHNVDVSQEMGLRRAEPAKSSLAGEFGSSRFWLNQGVIAIRGQSFRLNGEKKEAVATDQVVGCVVGPMMKVPNVFAIDKYTVEEAEEKRITDKQRVPGQNGEPGLPEEVVTSIKSVVEHATCSNKKFDQWAIFSKHKIQEWAADHQWFTDVKSKKWSEKRMESALKRLYDECDPYFRFKGSIKLEQMQEGKAPRILIADGDEGQVMALLAVKCFEDLLFHHMEERSTKHCDRDESRVRACKMHRRTDRKVSVIEGDGSAWDFTNTHPMRQVVENTILRHIVETLVSCALCPAGWLQAYQKVTTKKKIRVFFDLKCEDEPYVLTLEAVRRSGERGTSCLNWWMNFTTWISVLFPPECAYKFLDPRQRWGKDRNNEKRYLAISCEGDDSLLSTAPEVTAESTICIDSESRWYRCGFNMKIIYATQRATFTGSWFLVDANGLTGEYAPEIPRLMTNWPFCCSSEGKRVAKEGDVKGLAKLQSAAVLSRAYDLAGKFPKMCEKFLHFATQQDDGVVDYELSMRTMGTPSLCMSDIEHKIELRNAVPQVDEAAVLSKFGLQTTRPEYDKFIAEIWIDHPDYFLDENRQYRNSIPKSWQ